MLKWKITALLGVVFGIAGLGWGYAQQRNAVGFYELRVYTAQPGKRDALAIKHFAGDRPFGSRKVCRHRGKADQQGRHTKENELGNSADHRSTSSFVFKPERIR